VCLGVRRSPVRPRWRRRAPCSSLFESPIAPSSSRASQRVATDATGRRAGFGQSPRAQMKQNWRFKLNGTISKPVKTHKTLVLETRANLGPGKQARFGPGNQGSTPKPWPWKPGLLSKSSHLAAEERRRTCTPRRPAARHRRTEDDHGPDGNE
jgi:hypothetical protein